jgi:nucleoid DNA-binding protein
MVSTSYTDQRTPAALLMLHRASETQCVSRTMCRGTSSRSDGGYSPVCKHMFLPVASELNTLAPHAPGGCVQRPAVPAPVRRCTAPATPLGLENHAEVAHLGAICAGKCTDRGSVGQTCETANVTQNTSEEMSVNHSETIREISKRLPHLKRRDVAEVLEVMTELWLNELAQPGQTVTIGDLGKLVVEVQTIRTGGGVQKLLQDRHGRAPKTMKRVYVRFRPTAKLRQAVLYKEEGA